MHLYDKRTFKWKGLAVTLIAFVAVIVLFVTMLNRTGNTADTENALLLETAIRRAAVTSYATEGRYPATLQQIIDEYGVVVDENRFVVRYEVVGENVMPTIYIAFKGENAT